jgi:hypothetical protein
VREATPFNAGFEGVDTEEAARVSKKTVTVRRLLRSQTRAPGDLSEERIIEVSSEDSEDDMAMNDDADLDSNLLSEYGGTISRSYRKLRAAVPRKRRSGNFSQVLISRMG